MIIGIDPDLVKSGVGVVERGRVVDLKALPFYELLRYIDERRSVGDRFVLEDVEANKTTYTRALREPNRAKREAMMKKIAQDVGKVKAIGRLLEAYLEQSGADYVKIKPLVGAAKQAKKSADYFNRITGWTGRSNEDKRDAAMLALSVSK